MNANAISAKRVERAKMYRNPSATSRNAPFRAAHAPKTMGKRVERGYRRSVDDGYGNECETGSDREQYPRESRRDDAVDIPSRSIPTLVHWVSASQRLDRAQGRCVLAW